LYLPTTSWKACCTVHQLFQVVEPNLREKLFDFSVKINLYHFNIYPSKLNVDGRLTSFATLKLCNFATQQPMNLTSNKLWQDRIYLLLAGIFVASLISSNLIFQKFFFWTPLEFLAHPEAVGVIAWLSSFTFELSVGILPYPITFLVTDLISEIYGREKANRVVLVGFISSIFIMGVVMVGDMASATQWSPVDDNTFSRVFGLFGPAVFASMTAYITAQFIDIRIFHFWKRKTKNRHLWLRNNGSTIFSQLIDTLSVLLLLCTFGVIEWVRFYPLLINGFLFKVLVALIDTPFFYLFSNLLRKLFNLKLGEEVEM